MSSQMERPKTISIDLDGTLYKQEEWIRAVIGVVLPGAIDELQKLKDDGWDIVIHTARLPEHMHEIEKKLIADGIPFDRIWSGKGKPWCDVYLDDRGITFNGDWAGIKNKIDAFNPWFGDKFLRPLAGDPIEQRIKSR